MSDSWKNALQGALRNSIKDSKQSPEEGKLVYSTDPSLKAQCSKCKELKAACVCEPEVDASKAKYIPVLRIEKSGRAGKTVTVIDQLPKTELFLRDLTTKLKKKCGSGGSYKMDGKEGVIEIQGDKREIIRAEFLKQGIQVKG